MQLRWGLVGCFGLAVLLEWMAPVVLGAFLAWRQRASWRWWFWGAGVFVVFQGVLRVPLVLFLQTRPSVQEALKEPLGLWLWVAGAAFSAGLVEEGGRWLAMRWVVPQQKRSFSTAMMLGAGHGGAESIAVGLLVLSSLLSYVILALVPPEELPAEALQQALEQFQTMHSWEPLLGAWERLATLVVHLALSVMVWLSFSRSALWWWGALIVHTLVNFSVVAVLRVVGHYSDRLTAMLVSEALVGAWAVAAGGFLFLVARKTPQLPPPTPDSPAPSPAELSQKTEPGSRDLEPDSY